MSKTFISKRVMKLIRFDKQRGKCALCKTRYPIEKLEIDHVMPKAAGGADAWVNFQLLCRPCNAWKRAKVAEGQAHTLFDSPKPLKVRIPSDRPGARRQKAYRERRIAQGLCGRCGFRPLHTRTVCQECNEVAKQAVYKKRRQTAIDKTT